MARTKKPVRVYVDNITHVSDLVASDPYGYVRVNGHKGDEPDRAAGVYFTNPGTARAVAERLMKWANEMDALKQAAQRGA